jgi:hypothetical protein
MRIRIPNTSSNIKILIRQFLCCLPTGWIFSLIKTDGIGMALLPFENRDGYVLVKLAQYVPVCSKENKHGRKLRQNGKANKLNIFKT